MARKAAPRSYFISAIGRYNFSQGMISPLYTEMQAEGDG
jgi:hypothetical protein